MNSNFLPQQTHFHSKKVYDTKIWKLKTTNKHEVSGGLLTKLISSFTDESNANAFWLCCQ